MKKIGIVGWGTGDNSIGITRPYYYFFQELFGGIVQIINPMDDENIHDLDLLVLPGGPDINPLRYNERPHIWCGKPCHFLEFFDVNVLPQYIAKGTPIFGICRGMQTLNVHFGGSMNQHIFHPTSKSTQRDEEVHNIYKTSDYNATSGMTKSSRKNHLKNKVIQAVNSLHHQSINRLGEGIIKVAVADDGEVEVIKHRELPIYGVQYHPEEVWDNLSIRIINELLNNNANEQN